MAARSDDSLRAVLDAVADGHRSEIADDAYPDRTIERGRQEIAHAYGARADRRPSWPLLASTLRYGDLAPLLAWLERERGIEIQVSDRVDSAALELARVRAVEDATATLGRALEDLREAKRMRVVRPASSSGAERRRRA